VKKEVVESGKSEAGIAQFTAKCPSWARESLSLSRASTRPTPVNLAFKNQPAGDTWVHRRGGDRTAKTVNPPGTVGEKKCLNQSLKSISGRYWPIDP
jgi:hypothetical protein